MYDDVEFGKNLKKSIKLLKLVRNWAKRAWPYFVPLSISTPPPGVRHNAKPHRCILTHKYLYVKCRFPVTHQAGAPLLTAHAPWAERGGGTLRCDFGWELLRLIRKCCDGVHNHESSSIPFDRPLFTVLPGWVSIHR